MQMKSVFNMSGNFGRKRRMSAFVVTGNKNGIAGDDSVVTTRIFLERLLHLDFLTIDLY